MERYMIVQIRKLNPSSKCISIECWEIKNDGLRTSQHALNIRRKLFRDKYQWSGKNTYK